MKSYEKVFVLDTNVILNSPDNIKALSNNGEHLVVIPEIVVGETDKFKDFPDGKGYAARQLNKLFKEAMFTNEEKQVVIDKQMITAQVVHAVTENGLKVMFLGLKPYPKREDVLNSDSMFNDFLIVYTAKVASAVLGDKVTLITDDMNCKLIALTQGVDAEQMVSSRKTDFPEHFVKVESDEDWTYKQIEDVYPDYEYGNFSFEVTSSSGKKSYFVVGNGKCLPVSGSLPNSMLQPKNISQKLFCEAILQPEFQVVVGIGAAGSGKTLAAMLAAMVLVDDPKTRYEKIHYWRNTIDALSHRDQEIGFKKGDMSEKLSSITGSLFDALAFIGRRKYLKLDSKNRDTTDDELITRLMGEYNIEAPYIGGARGKSAENTIYIVDETQNFSEADMQLLITRLDDSCKLIVIGSLNQIDGFYLNIWNNALSAMREATLENDILKMFFIEMQGSLRGKFAEFGDKFFTKRKGKR